METGSTSKAPGEAVKPEQNQQEPEKKHIGLAKRAVLTLAFTTIGMKFSNIGLIWDAKTLLREEKTFGDKLAAIFSGRLPKKIWHQIIHDGQRAAAENPELPAIRQLGKAAREGGKTFFRSFRYSTIIAVFTVIPAALIGWTRADRLTSAWDIFKHPIKSVKLVFGPAPGQKETNEPQLAKKKDTPSPVLVADNAVNWQQRVNGPEQEAAAVSR